MVLEAVGRGGRVYSNATASNKPSVSDTLGGVFGSHGLSKRRGLSLSDLLTNKAFIFEILHL